MTGQPEHPGGGDADRSSVDRIKAHRSVALHNAWNSLGRYKFLMFGYWAASWVQHNKLLDPLDREGNPWLELCRIARGKLDN